jgi:hypothetical protein
MRGGDEVLGALGRGLRLCGKWMEGGWWFL